MLYSANWPAIKGNAVSYACALLMFALPYSIRLTSLATILLLIALIIDSKVEYLKLNLKKASLLLGGLVLLYLMTGFSLLYTENLNQGFFEMEKGITLIVFPVFFSLIHRITKEELHMILWSFVFSNLSLGLICIVYASYKYFFYQINIYFYHDLVGIFNSHATYYSVYLIFSILILIFLYREGAIRWKPKFTIWVIGVFFTVLIYLLGARSTVILFTLAVPLSIFYFIIKSGRFLVGGVIAISFFIIMFTVVNNNPHLKERIIQLKDYKYELSKNHVEGYNGLTTRLAQWESSIEIIRRAPIIGVGVGDVQDQLQEVYIKNYLKYSYMEKFNAHNEFIQTLLGLGFIGLVIFLFSLVSPLYFSFKHGHSLHVCFILLFAYCCLTESMLHVQKGIVFLALFSSIFFNYFFTDNEKPNLSEISNAKLNI